jgi:serine/threonine protein kinase
MVSVNLNKFIFFLGNENDTNLNYLLIFEYTDSGTLRSYLKDNFCKLNWNVKLQFAIQIADAISYIHGRNIIHCGLVGILNNFYNLLVSLTVNINLY